MTRTMLARVLLTVAAVGGLVTSIGAPAGAARRDADLAASVGQPGVRYWDVLVGHPMSMPVWVEAPPGINPIVYIDTSGLSDRVVVGPLPGRCNVNGSVISCYGETYSNLVDVPLRPAAGAAPGPAGKVVIRAESTPGTDPNPGNDVASFDVDVLGPGSTTPTVSVPEVSGRVGDVVTMPVTVTNPGPNTLYLVSLASPTGVDGAEYVSGAGCTQPPLVQCRRTNVRIGSYTVELRFRIVSCGSAIGPGARFGLGWTDNEVPGSGGVNTVTFRVSGCSGSGTATNPTAAETVPSPTSSPAATASDAPTSSPSGANEASNAAPVSVAEPAGSGVLVAAFAGGGLVLALIAAASFWAWRRRRTTPQP